GLRAPSGERQAFFSAGGVGPVAWGWGQRTVACGSECKVVGHVLTIGKDRWSELSVRVLTSLWGSANRHHNLPIYPDEECQARASISRRFVNNQTGFQLSTSSGFMGRSPGPRTRRICTMSPRITNKAR